MQPCPTCGRQVPDVAIHNAEMLARIAVPAVADDEEDD
jgi:hypothetical protein